ncbi:MAG: hypothetical protein ACNYPH_04995 [Gammaproteobacteria bacterium WSBS_2016_MAG_OTU1]
MRPLLFSLPPEAAHNAAVAALRLVMTCRPPSQPPQVHSKESWDYLLTL